MNARSFASYAAIMLWCNASETAGEGPGPETPARSASAPPFSFPSPPGKPRRDASATPETRPFSMSREPRVVPPALSTTALSLAFKRSFSSSRRRVSCSSLASLRVDARRSRRAASRSDVIRSRRARDSSSARSRRFASAARAAASASRDTLSRSARVSAAATSARARARSSAHASRAARSSWRSRSSRNSTSHVRARSAASGSRSSRGEGYPRSSSARFSAGTVSRSASTVATVGSRRGGGVPPMALDRRSDCGPEISSGVPVPSASRPDAFSSASPANDRSASRTPAEESRCAYILGAQRGRSPRRPLRRARRGHSRPRTGRSQRMPTRFKKRGSNSALTDDSSETPRESRLPDYGLETDLHSPKDTSHQRGRA